MESYTEENDWWLIDPARDKFEEILSKIVQEVVLKDDFVTFEPTFIKNKEIQNLELSKDKNRSFDPFFHGGPKRLVKRVSEDFLQQLFDNTDKHWNQKGLENISFFRDSKAYLETITHHGYIFVSASLSDLKKYAPDCDIHSVSDHP